MNKAIVLLLGVAIAQCVILHTSTHAPQKWRKLNTVSDEVSFTFNLRQCNLDHLKSLFWDISNPKSENYANYLTLDEINEITFCEGDKEKVLNFFSQFKLSGKREFAHAVKVTCSVEVAESMLRTKFFDFQHHDSGKIYTRQLGEVHIPDELENIVSFISGVSDFFHDVKYSPIAFGSKIPHVSMQTGPYDPNTVQITDPYINPYYIQSVYGIPSSPLTSNQSGIGIGAFDNDFDEEALCRFQDLFFQYSEAPQFTQIGPNNGSDQIESDLDVQYSTAVARGAIPYFANHPSGEWILDWAQQTVADNGRPQVWSLSYGWPEIWQCGANSPGINCSTGMDSEMYIDATNVELQKLGLLGVTVVVSSGDDGTPGFSSNCPMNPIGFIGGTSCAAAMEDDNCECGEIIAVYTSSSGETDVCQIPNGILYGTCGSLGASGLAMCTLAYNEFISNFNYNSAGEYCNMSSSLGITDGNSYFYSNCTCDALAPVTYSLFGASCTVSGYSDYNPEYGPAFLPDFPTTSPFVTSVGATAAQFSSNCRPDIKNPEIYAQSSNPSGFSGGGGFSSFQTAPSFQESFIANYLQEAGVNLPPNSTFNSTMRGYPDVSFNGHNYVVAIGLTALEEGNFSPTSVNGGINPISGTSASAPAFAGMIARINDYLIANNHPPLGYLNQMLYQMAQESPSAFNDITPQEIPYLGEEVIGGSYTGCTQQYCCEYGFPITNGWDAGTGLGTPNFPPFFKYVISSMENRKSEQ